MDIDREINALKKLIPSATGERLTYLTQRLSFLLAKQQEQERVRLTQTQEDDTVEPPLESPQSFLNISQQNVQQEDNKVVKISKINSDDLNNIYLTSEGVKDFLSKCLDHFMTNNINEPEVQKMISLKSYAQVKVEFEYYHDKLYEPSLKTTKRSFYVGKIIDRSNLVQSPGELRSAMEAQIKEILIMMDNFENQGSNWVIVRPLQFKVRFIRFSERFRRARGFIPTPLWLHGRKAIINIQNDDDYCFFKCIYRYFNRDTKNRHDYRDMRDEVVNQYFEQAGIDISMFHDGITNESVRQFELTNKIGINIFYIDKRGPEHCRQDYISVYNDTDMIQRLT